MKRKNLVLIITFFFWSITTPGNSAAPETTSSLINKVRDAIDGIKPFKVNFIQQVFDEEQLEIEESGEIVFKNRQTLKWTYLEPDYKVFLLIGDDYKFYDEDNEQLIIGKVKNKNQQWIWQLLFSKEMAEYIKTDEKNKIVYLKNEADNLDMEIRISSDNLPIKAIQKDPSGAVLVYFFKDYEKRIKINDKVFDLQIPDGVDIITE